MTRTHTLAIVTHGGAGAEKAWEDGCEKAALAGLERLQSGAVALEAAIQAAVVLEDDPRFNAGYGSRLRMDGQTVEMDAAVMDSQGRLASVAALTGVRNPVLVARELLATPHVFIAGQGALDFARKRGFAEFNEVPDNVRKMFQESQAAILKGDFSDTAPEWQGFDLPAYWNFPSPIQGHWPGCDTIGAVVRDGNGDFAIAVSTGGSSPMLRGRVGDTPLPGCGFFAGPAGGVAVTGIGEEIIRKMLAREVYDLIARGRSAQSACDAGLALFPRSVPIGIIALAAEGAGVASNRDMPHGRAEAVQ